MRRLLLLAALLPAAALAGEPVIVDARAERSGDLWRFAVTVSHDDLDWDHYVDLWEILTLEGTRIAVRELKHPHRDEQPFTRTLSAVRIPAGVDRVLIRAHDTGHGWGEPVALDLPR
jgi:hypothetical protein